MAKKGGNQIGTWAFLIGVVIAILIGLFGNLGSGTLMPTILLILGLVIGALNISASESKDFLIAATVLVIVSNFGASAFIAIPKLASTLSALLMLFVPAAVIVAIRVIAELAKR